MQNFNKIKAINAVIVSGALMWCGHFAYVWGEKQVQRTKKQLALWALNNVEISDRELTERGFYPVSVAIPPTCIRLCNDITSPKNQGNTYKKNIK